jgi:hypothetical protein
MDRSDEFDRSLPSSEQGSRNTEQVTGNEERAGDVLGLGGAAVPKAPGDPSADNDPASVAKRRGRMERENEERPEVTSDRSSGATGIDMGAGGSGTDISGS